MTLHPRGRHPADPVMVAHGPPAPLDRVHNASLKFQYSSKSSILAIKIKYKLVPWG